MTQQQIQTQIHDGGAAMPAFGDVLSAEDLQTITSFLAKQKAKGHGSRSK